MNLITSMYSGKTDTVEIKVMIQRFTSTMGTKKCIFTQRVECF